jgi:hypothetical protein
MPTSWNVILNCPLRRTSWETLLEIKDEKHGTKLANVPISLPPLEEQRQIVAEVERRLSVAWQVESTVEGALVRASRLRQAVLNSAFEGRLIS